MRIIALGDTHGRNNWQRIAERETFDQLIFIGDYLDIRDGIPPAQQIRNFEAILNFKKENKSSVSLLLGNHDFHYLLSNTERYSGFQFELQAEAAHLIQSGIDDELIISCLIIEDLLFSHAGVTSTWCLNNHISETELQMTMNKMIQENPSVFNFTYGKNFSPYGDDIEQSPIWVRPASLKADMIHGFTQIVGHTTQNKLVLGTNPILIDTLGTSGEYLIWENGVFEVGKA